jgi:hypothetical protein
MADVGDLVSIFLLSLLATLNPTLLAAVTVMLLLPNPKKLMLGYLLGAYLTSITIGLLIVFSLNDTESVSSAKHTLSPIEDVVVGLIALLVAYVLGGERAEPLRERRRRRKERKAEKTAGKESLPERLLGRGSPRITFALGVVFTFPGVSYLTALDRIAKLDYAVAPTVLVVVVFCLIQQLLLEVPLLGYAIRPERTAVAVTEFRDWLARNGHRAATVVAAAIGGLLLSRGVIELL